MPRPVRSGQLFPQLEQTADLNRGQLRFASEALLAALAGDEIPENIMARALTIADAMARS